MAGEIVINKGNGEHVGPPPSATEADKAAKAAKKPKSKEK